MDSNILPPDKDIKTIGKTWFVPASSFGQVIGNDVASDLDKISGSIQLRRERNINLNDTATVHISKKGSSMDNRIMFVYAPQKKHPCQKSIAAYQLIQNELIFTMTTKITIFILFDWMEKLIFRWQNI
ncbi:MAG: hypothetical protein OMM_06728 [Candidatus Magnetoglobus multicellularis str. Araruama]|uniref:Uncharacterized protein n=1 Tax=Candidatus Magnetoglobus multicellularis str. Araruama TaxID=890399 RepID=A0A1V1PFX9_9BACT|nr:MAG: hypothetical protein OMM_06728 [Candidatus Magnetoglobus multicellularis str. Araruama]